ncbi:MAG: adenylate kinase [Acidobacteriota bacterium]|nr:adenylate kinase [Blastocatellia bacterium]MDW8412646.1 adenylate kinase [Acidobacteriota bacterium]
MSKGKILVMVGAPGAGKGTQAKRLEKEFGIPQISTGDILRAMAKEDSPLGRQLHEIQSAGKLVSDEILFEVVRKRTAEPDCVGGYILDGYPRTLAQAEQLDRIAEEQGRKLLVLSIEVSDELLLQRLTGRRICCNCGAIFNVYLSPPVADGVCDFCGGSLVQRDDDKVEVIERRIQEYYENTAPLISRYSEAGLLYRIDGSKDPAAVFEELSKYVTA